MKADPRRFLATLLLCVTLGIGVVGTAAGEDSRADEIAVRSMNAMGGTAAWQATRLLRFDWAVERDGDTVVRFSHWWDRSTGDYRLEGTTGEGDSLRVLFNIESRSGQAWVAGKLLTGEAAVEQIEGAYARFINDTYWLLMPWKWLDPGVLLTYEGERQADGRLYDVVRLEFGDGIGLTSHDRYWGWVARDSGLMERWEYVLQDEAGNPGSDDPTVWTWEEWVDAATGIRLSTVKRRVGGEGDVRITFPRVETDSDLSAAEIEALLHPVP